MAIRDALYTAEHLLAMPDDARFELVRGELRELTPSVAMHGVLSQRIALRLGNFVEAAGIDGYVTVEGAGFVLARNPDTVRAPDVAYIAGARVPDGPPDTYFPAPPDLAVEIISEHDRAGEVQAKVLDYLRAGTALVWVVYPQTRTVVVHASTGGTAPTGSTAPDGSTAPASSTLDSDEVLTGEPALPGFRLPVRDIFAVLER